MSMEEFREGFMMDIRVHRLIDRIMYTNCEQCGHEVRWHRQATDLPMPSKCVIGDCVCHAPAKAVREKKIKSALKYLGLDGDGIQD